MSFVCVWCYDTGGDALVRYATDQYVIEVAAKRNDGGHREKQTSTFRLCKEHAAKYVQVQADAFHRNALAKPWK